jgi:hypothetical protein
MLIHQILYKIPTLVSSLNHTTYIPFTPSAPYLLKTGFNILLPRTYTCMAPNWVFLLVFRKHPILAWNKLFSVRARWPAHLIRLCFITLIISVDYQLWNSARLNILHSLAKNSFLDNIYFISTKLTNTLNPFNTIHFPCSCFIYANLFVANYCTVDLQAPTYFG